jgi:hypothetical protein
MDPTNLAAITIVLLVFYVGTQYCVRFLRGEIAPRIATWLIFEMSVSVSLASYLAGRDHSLTKAVLNAADCIQVTVILFVLVIGRREQKVKLTRKDII